MWHVNSAADALQRYVDAVSGKTDVSQQEMQRTSATAGGAAVLLALCLLLGRPAASSVLN
jgi:hypothetical protein